MIKSFKVGFEKILPDWFLDLMNNNTIITHGPVWGGITSATVQTTHEGTQVANMGDYIKQYPNGTLHVERISSIKVNESMFVVHSSTNGMN
jgi:hypothetical protein